MGWGFVEKIGKGLYQTTAKSIEFVTDIIQEGLTDEDEFEGDGIADTIWGSWNDNILGKDGAMQGAIGPEGVGGTIIGAIPEQQRQQIKSVITPVFDTMDYLYQNVVDDPLSAGVLVFDGALSSGGDWSTIFNGNTWKQAFDIAETRSLGQALTLAALVNNPYDEAEVLEAKQTGLFNMMSGSIDLFANIALDPLAWAGKPAMLAAKYARNGRFVDVANAGRTFRNPLNLATGGAEFVKTRRFQRFQERIDGMADDISEGLTDRLTNKKPLSGEDIGFVDQLAGQVFKEFKNVPGMTEELAYAVSRYTGENRSLVARLAMGDNSALRSIEDTASQWVKSAENSDGALTRVSELEKEIDDLVDQLDNLSDDAFPQTLQGLKDDISTKQNDLDVAEKDLLDSLNEMPSELPFVDALNIRELKLRDLPKLADEVADTASENARLAVLNENPYLVQAAADQIMLQVTGAIDDGIGALSKPLSVSMVGNLGYGVKTFVSNTPFLGTAASFTGRKLTVFSEKVPQQIMNWDDPSQSFGQFEKMIRDASRVTTKRFRRGNKGVEGKQNLMDKVGLNPDELLGQWARKTTQQSKQRLFQETTDKLNKGIVDLYGDNVLRGYKEAEKLQIMNFALQKMKGDLSSAQTTLRSQAANARIYGNNAGISFTIAEEGAKSVQRQLHNFTPQQLAQSSLVPRYDLIANLFDQGGLRKATGNSQEVLGELMSVWKKSVLLRPAWPIRVLSDELARSAALLGGIETLQGAMRGFNDLRAQWFARNGEDVMTPSLAKMRTALKDKGVKDVDLLDKGELYERYLVDVADGSQKAVTKLVKDTISEEYGKRRIRNRTGAFTAVGYFAMGPAGLAAAGLYNLYARKSMQKLAIKEIGQNFAYQLRDVAKGQLGDEIAELRRRADDPVDALTAAESADQIEDLRNAADLLEIQSKTLLGGYRVRDLSPSYKTRESTKRQQRELDRIYGKVDESERSAALVNFDRVGQLMNDARVGGYYMGGFKFANEFGDTPYDVGINKQSLSSNNSNRALVNSLNKQSKDAIKIQPRVDIKYDNYVNDPNSQVFNNGFNDTVNKQWKPEGEDYGREFQDFTRMFWDNKSNDNILAWLNSSAAKPLRTAMPDHMRNADNKLKWVEDTRTEINNILPPVQIGDVDDIFQPVRQKLAKGKDISWKDDIEPRILEHTQLDKTLAERNVFDGITEIRNIDNGMYNDFGKIPASSSIIESMETAGVFKKATGSIDNLMEAFGTDTVDNLSRSTVFAGVYRREVSRRAQAYRNPDGTYSLTPERLKRIEDAARRQGVKETRSLLYDLADRGRFEEMVGTIMPFYGAWQEVLTTWSGLAVKNPVFVARGIRYFKALEGEDEEGNQRFVYRLPEGLLSAEIAGTRVFGKLGELGFTSLKVNPLSMSMLSAGAPGFGPVVSALASETIIRNPELQESLDWMLPYGASEGTSMLDRVTQQIEPTFVRRMRGGYFDTAERQKMLAQVAVDLAVQWSEAGNEIMDERTVNNFSDEVERRTNDLLKVRALAGLAMPVSFSLQSPYHEAIEGYRKRVEEKGFDFATDWLINDYGEEFFALTARRTMVRGVASATLKGEKNYRQHQEFADRNPLLKDFIIGKVGPDDVGFEFNYAVYKTEIAEGRRERATPEEILRQPQQNRGWAKWGEVRNLVYEELDRRGQLNGSASLRANSNNDLRNLLEVSKTDIRAEHPLWWSEYNSARDPLKTAKVIDGFREVVDSEAFAYRPDVVQLEEYLETRDLIAEELNRRWKESGDVDNSSLKSRSNQDLEDLWDAVRTGLRVNPQFSKVFDRYLESDNIERNSWVVKT